MAKKKQADADLTMGFVAPAALDEETKPANAFDALLGGGDETTELDDKALGALDDEFRVLAQLKAEESRLDARLSEVKRDLAAQRQRMLDAMELQGTKQFRGAQDEGSCHIAEEYTTTLENPQRFMDWVKEQAPELLTVNSRSRTSFIRREYRDKGVPVDSDTFPPGVSADVRKVLRLRSPRVTQSKE